MSRPNRGVARWAVAIGLLAVVAFSPALFCDFVNLDDQQYVTENAHVLDGLSPRGVAWAFSPRALKQDALYIPLTWVSLMIDASVWGDRPMGFHLTNILLHAANGALLFLVLVKATGRRGFSAAAAALFALHPLHVESVAWVTERKDVLSALFGLLALWTYLDHARGSSSDRRAYGWTLAWFVASLLAKPMLVTLPVVFLLFDYWPLRRLPPLPNERSWAGWARLIRQPVLLEKAPFFAIALLAGLVTIGTQAAGKALSTQLPLDFRVAYAAYALGRYLLQAVWPWPLYVSSFRADVPFFAWKAVGGAAVLLGMTLWAEAGNRRRPAVWMGWLFFVVTILPVSGVLQTGAMGTADRFMYWPIVGLLIAAVWGVGEAARTRAQRSALVALLGLLLALYALLDARQIPIWRDSGTLARHALSHQDINHLMHNNYGNFLQDRGFTNEALMHLERAVRLAPDQPQLQHNYGAALMKVGRLTEARAFLERAHALRPDQVPTLNNLAFLSLQMGDWTRAHERLQQALRLDPDNAITLRNLDVLKNLLLEEQRQLGDDRGRWAEHSARRIAAGDEEAALRFHRRWVGVMPGNVASLNNLAWLLISVTNETLRAPAEAVELAQRAVLAGGRSRADVLTTWAEALLADGQKQEAAEVIDWALPMARDEVGRAELDNLRHRAALVR